MSKALNKGSVFVTDGVSVGSSYYIGGVLGYNDAEGSNYVSELKNEGTVKVIVMSAVLLAVMLLDK